MYQILAHNRPLDVTQLPALICIKCLLFIVLILLSGQLYAQDNSGAKKDDPLCITPTVMDRTRPEPRSEPTKVSVSVYVLDIEHIDDINQDFTIDVIINLQWHDPRLIHPHDLENHEITCIYKLDEVWTPHITLYNLRDIKPILDKTIRVKPDGSVNYLQRYFGTLTAFLDLRLFPFDSQKLPIILLSTQYGPDKLKLVFNAKDTGHEKRFSIPNWQLHPGEPTIGKVTARSDHIPDTAEDYAKFEYSYYAKRDLTYYIWKVIIPMTLIVLMSWTVFWVNPRQIEAEIGLSATTILTLIAFLFNLNSLLPRIPYLTKLDFFILFSLILVFLSFLEVIITCSMAISGKLKLAIYIDRACRVAFPLLYLATFYYFIILH